MIAGIGIDIIEIQRVKKAIERDSFIERVYSEREREYCSARRKGAAESYAGRFAAKEAVLKAFGTGLRDGKLNEIEILNDELGCPGVTLSGYFKKLAEERGITKIWVSISHSQGNAVAQCVMECN